MDASLKYHTRAASSVKDFVCSDFPPAELPKVSVVIICWRTVKAGRGRFLPCATGARSSVVPRKATPRKRFPAYSSAPPRVAVGQSPGASAASLPGVTVTTSILIRRIAVRPTVQHSYAYRHHRLKSHCVSRVAALLGITVSLILKAPPEGDYFSVLNRRTNLPSSEASLHTSHEI